MERTYQICAKCIMDTSDPDITFDASGVCNHCRRYSEQKDTRMVPDERKDTALKQLVAKIKREGAGKEYDCIIGVSGGVDSTYVAYVVKELGFKPLAVHFDNGWNSELAVDNIAKVLNKLNIDLFTYVIDWEEFRDLQLSFLRAGTPDGEIPTDHAINAILFREASKRNIKNIISGMNFATESISVPAWAYGHSDWKYIKSVHKKFGSRKLRTFPFFNLMHLFYWTFIKRIKVVAILNYVSFTREAAMDVLQNKLDWKYYGGKHYESIYTRFYQSSYLPRKFHFNKKRGHLSDLVSSGQITRDDALRIMDENDYSKELETMDEAFVMKKLCLTPVTFKELLNGPVRTYREFPNSYDLIVRLKKFVNFLRGKGLYTK